MEHARWSDIIRWFFPALAALGVWYILSFYELEALATFLAIISFISICFLEYYIPYRIKSKIDQKRLEKFKAKKQQEYEEIKDNLIKDSIICPICKSIVKKGNKYCYGCGNQV